MKTLTTFLVAVVASFSVTANAGTLMDSYTIGMNDVSQEGSYPADFREVIAKQDISFVKGQEPWALDNQLDFNTSDYNTADILQDIESNPTASGGVTNALNWDAVLNEY